MSHYSDETTRERFWRDLIADLNPRLRAYLRRVRCSEEDVEEILWDVWEELATSDTRVEAATDHWSLVQPILRRNCAHRVRQWRHECDLARDEPPVLDEEPRDTSQLCTWADQLLRQLPRQQRLAVDLRCRWRWPYWAVAAALEAAEPTARVHVARGLHQLRLLTRLHPPPIPE